MGNVTVKNCQRFYVTLKGLKCYFACKLTSEPTLFHGCWQKTQDPWVRDKRCDCSQHSSCVNFVFVSVLLATKSHVGHVEWPG